MPKIKRWFPVSHDINSDPEVIDLTDRFGLAGLKVWLEILSISDRNEGTLPGNSESIVRSLSIKCNTTQRHVRGILELIKRHRWVSDDTPMNVLNYVKYHRIREANRVPSEPSEPTRPNQTKPNPPKSPKRGTTIVDLVFLKFWKTYPKKVGQGAAYKSWCKEAKHCTDIQDEIFIALEWQKEQPQWLRDNGQYIPNPSTWLNQRRWTDQKVEANKNGAGRIEPAGFQGIREFLELRGHKTDREL